MPPRPKVEWDDDVDTKLLLDVLNKCIAKDMRFGEGFKQEAWDEVVSTFNKKKRNKTGQKARFFKRKLTGMKRNYNNYKALYDMAGFTWDEKKCEIKGDTEAWNMVTLPDMRNLKGKPFPHFVKFSMVYGDDLHLEDPEDVVSSPEKEGSYSDSEVDEDDCPINGQTEKSRKRGLRAKNNESDAEYEAPKKRTPNRTSKPKVSESGVAKAEKVATKRTLPRAAKTKAVPQVLIDSEGEVVEVEDVKQQKITKMLKPTKPNTAASKPAKAVHNPPKKGRHELNSGDEEVAKGTTGGASKDAEGNSNCSDSSDEDSTELDFDGPDGGINGSPRRSKRNTQNPYASNELPKKQKPLQPEEDDELDAGEPMTMKFASESEIDDRSESDFGKTLEKKRQPKMFGNKRVTKKRPLSPQSNSEHVPKAKRRSFSVATSQLEPAPLVVAQTAQPAPLINDAVATFTQMFAGPCNAITQLVQTYMAPSIAKQEAEEQAKKDQRYTKAKIQDSKYLTRRGKILMLQACNELKVVQTLGDLDQEEGREEYCRLVLKGEEGCFVHPPLKEEIVEWKREETEEMKREETGRVYENDDMGPLYDDEEQLGGRETSYDDGQGVCDDGERRYGDEDRGQAFEEVREYDEGQGVYDDKQREYHDEERGNNEERGGVDDGIGGVDEDSTSDYA